MVKYYLTYKGIEVSPPFSNPEEMIEHMKERITKFGGSIQNYGYTKVETTHGFFKTSITI